MYEVSRDYFAMLEVFLEHTYMLNRYLYLYLYVNISWKKIFKYLKLVSSFVL
jgi:hypothetical protein